MNLREKIRRINLPSLKGCLEAAKIVAVIGYFAIYSTSLYLLGQERLEQQRGRDLDKNIEQARSIVRLDMKYSNTTKIPTKIYLKTDGKTLEYTLQDQQ